MSLCEYVSPGRMYTNRRRISSGTANFPASFTAPVFQLEPSKTLMVTNRSCLSGASATCVEVISNSA